MKAAKPVDVDHKSHQNQNKKQRQKMPAVIPLSEVDMAHSQTQKSGESSAQTGLPNPNRMGLNGMIAPVHGSQTIYDQGSQIMYTRFQQSLSETSDINHPDTQLAEKKYIASLSIDQIADYHQLKSGTYLPKTMEEQAEAHQQNKKEQEAKQSSHATNKISDADLSLADLSNSSATQLAERFNTVQDNSTALLNSQTEKATHQLPKVNAKTGSAFSGAVSKNKTTTDKTVTKSSKKTVKSVAQQPKSKEISFPQNEPLKKTSYSFSKAENKNAGFEKQALHELKSVTLNTSAIPTTMQQNAYVDLTGEADTENLSIERNDVAQDLTIKKNQAAKDIHKDHGEHNIIKKPNDEMLKSSCKINSKAVKKKPLDTLKMDGMDEATINAQFEPMIHSKIGAENEKYQAAELEHNQKVLAQEKATEAQIGTEKKQSQEKQRKSVKDAQTDVHHSRVEWQSALDKTESDFAKKSGDHAKATLGNIKTEKSKGETTAQGHIDTANKAALKEKTAADTKAKNKKSEMDKQSGGFFGWVSDKVSQFIDALKDALNIIFTALRKAVKAIFDAAKTLVLAALELARKAIVNLIKAFASLLKGFLDIALAAFPGIRDRLKAKIDKFVAVAEKFVNQTFEAFKKAVVAAIDFLADVVDQLIGALQDFYNLILDAVNFIVAGIIKIMEGLANLVSSAMVMPDNFMGQISEEFLGMDVTRPLPFEKTVMPELSGSASDSEYSDLLGKNSYNEEDFHVEPQTNNMELSPEILSQLQDSNGEINFGNNNNTLDLFKQSAAGSEDMQGETSTAEKQDIPADSYAQADWFINYQNNQSPPSTDTDSASGKNAATESSMPEDMKLVGPWTPLVRMYYLKEQMWAGIKKNWAENKWKYIGIGAAIVLGITALAILTAGAIFSLIPPALEIFATIMMAQAIAKASGFFKTFMTDGWLGKTATAGKALARAIGIILVELIFILLFDSAALFKVLKTAAKGGVKGVVNLAKTGAKSTLKAGKNALVATGKGFVKQAGKAKFFVQGIGKGIAKGAKNLDELGENLAKRFKFKGFKIVVKGFKFYLYGSVNPWVLLASGEVKHIDDELSQGKKVGDKLEVDGIQARLIGQEDIEIVSPLGKDIGGSGFSGSRKVRDMAAQSIDKNKKIFKRIEKIDADDMLSAAEKSKKINSQLSSPSASALAKLKSAIKKEIKDRNKKGLLPEEAFPSRYEAHHIVPKEMEIQFGKVFDELGINLDEAFNGTMLPPVREFDEVVENAKNTLKDSEIPANFWNRAKHKSHPRYNEQISVELKKIFSDFNKMNLEQKAFAKDKFYKLVSEQKEILHILTESGDLRILR
ncbi:AHH domain-containing protein [Chryseobacterium sp. MYb264]|uniref:AHH domain-containing protein n=1 Tax=Chryseobacterium sp. MYb264 TaxID=2745153 RepID=UPI002E1426DA|nr:AHH domain-containing protein [Chryseobacterium sp. MYb264]